MKVLKSLHWHLFNLIKIFKWFLNRDIKLFLTPPETKFLTYAIYILARECFELAENI